MDLSVRKGRIAKEELYNLMLCGEIDTLIIAVCDMQGRLMGKRLTSDYCLRNGLKGTRFCVELLGTDMEMNTPDGYALMNWEQGYGDWLAQPDWSTLRVIPWLEKTAMVLADAVDEKTGEPVSVAPRSILKAQLKKAEALGFSVQMASELEFYLFRQAYEGIAEGGFARLRPSGHDNEDYSLLQDARHEPVCRKIRNDMMEAGIPVESSNAGADTGQHEISIRYADALTSADRHAFFKHGLKEICIQNGYAVTFMAKPHHTWTGSSSHLHVSLWDPALEKNLFYDENGPPYHMSPLMRHFLGGLLAYAREFFLFFASNVNSYKRFAANSRAPVHIVWGYDNRTAGFRVVGEGRSRRIECRIPGADINPYLAYAALIGAGLYGIEHGIEPPEEYKGNACLAKDKPRVPHSLYEALHLWRESEAVRQVFGETAVRHYASMARVELQTFDRVVTNWERERYFEQG